MILNYDLFLKSSDTRRQAQILFSNKRFLKIFLDVIGILDLSIHEMKCINKLAYDYYTIRDDWKDQEVSTLLLTICRYTNNRKSIALSGILGVEGSNILTMIANSSFIEEKCVHRVNTFILRCNIDLSVEDIINIYCILFEHFKGVFIYTMFESYSTNMDQQKFNNIGVAILKILDSLTSADIKRVLYDYAYILKMSRNYQIRFELKTAKEFPRILKCIKEIELEIDDLLIP